MTKTITKIMRITRTRTKSNRNSIPTKNEFYYYYYYNLLVDVQVVAVALLGEVPKWGARVGRWRGMTQQ